MKKNKIKNLIIPILIVLAGIFLTSTMARVVSQNKITEQKNKATLNAKIYAEYLTSDIEKGIHITDTIEQTIIASNGDVSNFSVVANNLMNDSIQSIQIAPNGVVSDIYPLKGNEAGFIDLMNRKDDRGTTCRYAKDHDVVVMQGPFDLLQGGKGIAIRNPIFLEENGEREFWGFSIVIVKVPDIFNDSLNDLSDLGYSFKVSKTQAPINDDYGTVYKSDSKLGKNPVSYKFKIGDTKWKIELTPTEGWSDPKNTIMTIAPSVLVFVAIALAIFFVSEHKDSQKLKQRQLLEENLEMMKKEKDLRHQVQLYAAAMGVEYPLAIDMDYMNNHYQMIEYDGAMNKRADYSGTMDELIQIAQTTIPDEKQARAFASLFSREKVIQAFNKGKKEISLRHKQMGDDGKTHWMETKAICIECNENTIRGISMSKCIDDEVKNEQLRIEAQKANRAKSDFLLRMSHDIRTPLNGIMGMLDIADEFENDLEKQKDCRIKARESAEVLLELISEVLDMSKLESGDITLESVSFDLKEISQTSCMLVSEFAKIKRVELIQKRYDVPVHRFIGSPVHYKRIIMNVMSNAVKYNKDNGKVYVSFKEIPLDKNKVNLVFTCSDTGVGMSKEFMKHIFEPFTQENNSARSSYEGTGLGMSIAKNLTEKMGGTIHVESQENVGTTFVVMIPFDVDVNFDAKKDEEEDSFNIEGYKIILAEDNALNMEIANFLLEEQGVQVIKASDGKQALDAFIESNLYEIDAILMDLMMPNMDGYEATKKIRALDRKDSKSVPIIALTASAFTEDRLAAKKAGMNEHLAKPLDAKLVVRTLYNCVEEYHKSVR